MILLFYSWTLNISVDARSRHWCRELERDYYASSDHIYGQHSILLVSDGDSQDSCLSQWVWPEQMYKIYHFGISHCAPPS